jgi:hypothetical protein
MFSSPILDVVVGVLFAFMSISIAASATNEALASFLNRRGKALLDGIQDLLNRNSDGTALALEIYNHSLVHPQGDGTATTINDLGGKLPAYIEPAQFAAALVDGLLTVFPPKPDGGTKPIAAPTDGATALAIVADPAIVPPSPLQSAIEQITDPQLKRTLLTLYDRADGEASRFEKAVAGWFDGAMDHVSGVYKRYSQLWAFLIALLLVLLLNVDTLYLAKTLWQHPDAAQHLGGSGGALAADAQAAVGQLQQSGLPIGWTPGYFTDHAAWWTWLIALTGWLITAGSTLFGAPFWFDLLQKIVQLRGSGPTPVEKASEPSS